jgi:hypothetical protein
LFGLSGLSGKPFEKLVSAHKRAFQEESFKKINKELSAPIEILESREFENEIVESYKINE